MSLTEGQREWLRIREYLRRDRHDLGQSAAQEYPDLLRAGGTALLTRPEWLPTAPLPLDAIDLEFTPGAPITGVDGTGPLTASVRPERPDGSRHPTYSTAMADLAAPAVFENRSTYRLLDADLSGPRGRLVFGRGRYFDGADVGEAVAHEYAVARLTGTDTPLRVAIGNPCELRRRPVNIGIAALTVRRDRVTGDGTFLLHWRDPAKVGHAGGTFMVVPVGIFQAIDDQPGNEHNDFSLWRCLLREYAEELLGASEDYQGDQVDYDNWPFAARMTTALRSGLISAHVLGLGVDPLTFATDLLVRVEFDAALFDEIFAGIVASNAEGRLIGAGHRGLPFTPDQVRQLVGRRSMQPAGAAALILAAGG
ncbi:MAG TPA: XRE family transcriptional regulator [Pseudonocardiaceae bacterium]|jgi:hypothetical protein